MCTNYIQMLHICCVASLHSTTHATHAMHAMEEIRRNMTIYARSALYASHGHVPVSNRRRHLASFATSSFLFLLALCMNFDEMPLTRTYSLTALDIFDNHGYAPPIPCSVSCDIVPSKTTVANVGKPFVKPPTIGKPFVKLPMGTVEEFAAYYEALPLAELQV